MPWKFEHLPCNGTGTIPNEYFEYCRYMENPPKNCRECYRQYPETFTGCNEGEIISCPGCNGNGKIILEGEEWGSPEWL